MRRLIISIVTRPPRRLSRRYDLGLAQRNGFPVFSTIIEANHVAKKEKLGAAVGGVDAVSDDDKREILRLARDPRIAERIVRSLAPSLYGCRHAKTCVAFALFGGVAKDIENKHRIRGDINVRRALARSIGGGGASPPPARVVSAFLRPYRAGPQQRRDERAARRAAVCLSL